MALRKTLGKRLLTGRRALEHSSSPPPSLQNILSPNATVNFRREHFTSPESGGMGFFRRFFHRGASNQPYLGFPEIFSLPAGVKLREKLRGLNITEDRIRLEGIPPPPLSPTAGESPGKVSVQDAKKLLRLSLVEKLKAKLREIPENSISYAEYIRICSDACANQDQAFEFAKMLDDSGNVIVLGNVVFIRPEQVARSMDVLMTESIGLPSDPRREELEQMEKEKAVIDEKARARVRSELYCGLGLMLVQTVGFMRLTFWELSWDVMEPICFFVTSLHFALGYAFFLRTSVEPSFEGYFQRRFKSKQRKLMKIHNFDIDKYNMLRRAFYSHGFPKLCN